MTYSFDARIAKMYGVDEAVFIHNLYWWIRKNEANGRHYYDGRNWTYNSMKAFADLFPFWTEKQIRRIIRKLADNGAIHVGNYNQRGFDRTQWYALSETVISIYSYGHIHSTEWAHPFDQMGRPIPDSKPDSKPYIPPISPKGIDARFNSFWQSYPKKVGKGAAEKAFKKYKTDEVLLGVMLKALDAQKKSKQWQDDGGRYIPNPATWLNQKRWEDEIQAQPPAKQNASAKTGGESSLDMEKIRALMHGGAE